MIMSAPTLLAFGSNSHSQLATISTYDSPIPVQCHIPGSIAELNDLPFALSPLLASSQPLTQSDLALPPTQLTGGSNNTAIITSDGDLFMCGQNDAGQLGLGFRSKESVPLFFRVQFGSTADEASQIQIAQVACGWNHTIALDRKGNLWVFGDNKYGQLGLGPDFQTTNGIPMKLNHQNVQSVRFICISTGLRHSAAVTSEGEVFVWGFNKQHQLGLAVPDSLPSDETRHRSTQNRRKLQSNGSKYIIHHPLRLYFMQVGASPDERSNHDSPNEPIIKSVSCGAYHTVFLTSNNEIYTCGQNKYGQLGYMSSTASSVDFAPSSSIPNKLSLSILPFEKSGGHVQNQMIKVLTGWHHTCICSSESSLNGDTITTSSIYVFGRNDHGQLGLCSTQVSSQPASATSKSTIPTPTELILPFLDNANSHPKYNVVDIVSGSEHTLFLLSPSASSTSLPPSSHSSSSASSFNTASVSTSPKGTILLSCGWNEHGNCGVITPRLQSFFSSISSASSHSSSICYPLPTSDDILKQVEQVELEDILTPTVVHIPEKWIVNKIGCGYGHSIVYVVPR
ncbi:regulator of chromosome condensation 1/beta-lactamase-inhibitor protein II [Paraphysoderma sedebokerense]|nr:regulator of chromosome condensation 1/beta-lactamase-inhibitor protein II [Paraphysoderma sedebokerense]